MLTSKGWGDIQTYRFNNYYIDTRIDLNVSKSIQSAAELEDLKPAGNGRY